MMRRMAMACTLAAGVLALGAAAAVRADETGHHAAAKKTVAGEVVDMGCYVAHAAKGEKHGECAVKCIAGGMPMGLVTDAGDLYLLTLDHADADPYEKTKTWAGKRVKVTGPVYERGGIKTLDVSAVELAAAAPAKAK